jgi:hypothetical protein
MYLPTLDSATSIQASTIGRGIRGAAHKGLSPVHPPDQRSQLRITNEDSDNMSVFKISTKGALKQIAKSPFSTNVGSEGITITH